MAEPERAVPAVRIERGRAGAEELAALTVVLYALMARQDEGPGGPSARTARRPSLIHI
ncbi:acyl-CoA carboxylase subunit epsilon [Streptomyces vinaceusdrappus]|uniref:Acyl-CoA carboxylase subunit epsilon n=1 Tax=Streptomyces vinaceusdrappus TaxID=67376 RepID=A0ABY6C4I8_9ACTN|nr:acyl-CoA carboxylase epsilon subunit [Streptomyces vinaceusdrappus]UXI82903.1 acyl-CoA carboxylase subunit epsilon [Streptomyces vinaceusdrappus]